MLVDHSGNDPTQWSVVQIFYNGQVFANTTELNTAFADTTSGLNRQQVPALSLPAFPFLEVPQLPQASQGPTRLYFVLYFLPTPMILVSVPHLCHPDSMPLPQNGPHAHGAQPALSSFTPVSNRV